MLAFQPSAVVVMDGAVLPVDWVNTTPPAPIVPEYLTESAKYASSAVTRLRRSDFIEARYAFSFVLANFGIAIAAKMPMITTTISSSMSVKPLRFILDYPRLVNGGRKSRIAASQAVFLGQRSHLRLVTCRRPAAVGGWLPSEREQFPRLAHRVTPRTLGPFSRRAPR